MRFRLHFSCMQIVSAPFAAYTLLNTTRNFPEINISAKPLTRKKHTVSAGAFALFRQINPFLHTVRITQNVSHTRSMREFYTLFLKEKKQTNSITMSIRNTYNMYTSCLRFNQSFLIRITRKRASIICARHLRLFERNLAFHPHQLVNDANEATRRTHIQIKSSIIYAATCIYRFD